MRYLGVYIVQSRNTKCSLDAHEFFIEQPPIAFLEKLGELDRKKLFYILSLQNVSDSSVRVRFSLTVPISAEVTRFCN